MKELTLTIEDPDDGIKINALPEENLDDNRACCKTTDIIIAINSTLC